jgi:hypothetical protein
MLRFFPLVRFAVSLVRYRTTTVNTIRRHRPGASPGERSGESPSDRGVETVMSRPSWVPASVDVDRPNVARMYDYFLGGFHNFAADRDLAEQTLATFPQARLTAQANRAFLGRAVSHLVDQGVDQFLDVGSGVPTVGNVHEIAQAAAPHSRVVYVDIEPVAVTHSQQMLAENPNATAILADLREPEEILGHPEVAALLDLSRPVALLMVAVLHFVPEDDVPSAVIGRLRRALGAGSWLVMSHGTNDFTPPELTARVGALYQRTNSRAVGRTRQQVTQLFDGYSLVEPGIVLVEQWQPGRVADVAAPERCPIWVGVGRAG